MDHTLREAIYVTQLNNSVNYLLKTMVHADLNVTVTVGPPTQSQVA